MPAAAWRRMLVVSPHLDDAVLACGDLLAAHPGAIVVTVFAGRPPTARALTPWDADAGFRPGDDVIGARRREDRAALRLLRARPVWLELRDSQYGEPYEVADVGRALARVVDAARPTAVAIPFGLFHGDHALVHTAGVALARRRPATTWLAYEEPGYRLVAGQLKTRLASLARAGIAMARLAGGTPASERKRRAVACYGSQLRALATPGRPGHADAFAPEALWRLTP